MEKDNNKNIEKLLMALLVSRGISATTLGKMFGVNKSTISRMIPVSEIQKEIRKILGINMNEIAPILKAASKAMKNHKKAD